MRNGIVRNWMTAPVITVMPETRIYDARRIMDAEKIRHLVVEKRGELVGIVTRRGLLRADVSALHESCWTIDPSQPNQTVSPVMTASPITTSPETALPKAARVLLENKITGLPVMDKGQLVGILTASDMFRAVIAELPFLKETVLVRDYMIAQVITITPETSLLEAHRLMGVERIRALPVVADDEALTGMVTRTDLMSADPSRFTGKNQQEAALKIQTQSVERIMSRKLITTQEDANIMEAARLMLENKIHALPVLNTARTMTGILTESDLFRLIIRKFF